MKKSNGTIGNKTRDLPPCSAVPQPIAPPRAPIVAMYHRELLKKRPSMGTFCTQSVIEGLISVVSRAVTFTEQ